MTRTRPPVSVIVTTYDRNAVLERAIESAVTQEYDPLELIVVDGTADRTAEPVVEAFPDAQYHNLRDHHEPFETALDDVAAARQLGTSVASGEYVHFLDDDEILLPGAISEKVAAVTGETDAEAVYSPFVDSEGDVRAFSDDVRGQELAFVLIRLVTPCQPSVLLVRRSILTDIPPFHELPHDDIGMFVEIGKRTLFEYVDEPLTRSQSSPTLATSLASLRGQLALYESYTDSGLYDRLLSERQRDAAREQYERLKSEYDARCGEN